MLPTLANHTCQRTANDYTGLTKTLLQAVLNVKLARVNLNGLSAQPRNPRRKFVQDALRPLTTLGGRERDQCQVMIPS